MQSLKDDVIVAINSNISKNQADIVNVGTNMKTMEESSKTMQTNFDKNVEDITNKMKANQDASSEQNSNMTSILYQMHNHVSNNKLLNVSNDISRIVGQELGKTINLMSGRPNYNNTYFEDIDISKEEDKDSLINIDKVLRDLHYYDIKKYKELSNEFPPK